MTSEVEGRSVHRRGPPPHILRALPEIDPIARRALSLGFGERPLGTGAFPVRIRPALARRITRAIATGSIALGLAFGAALAPNAARADTFEVTTLADDGAGSLRQAVVDANGLAGADTITFASAVTGTITLTTGAIAIDGAVEIVGPGQGLLTVSGNDASQIFALYDVGGGPVTISGLTLRDGVGPDGGAIYVYNSDLVLENVTVTASTATDDGGGVYGEFYYDGSMLLRGCTISNNAAGSDGGGLHLRDGQAVTIERSSFTGNTAVATGGAMHVDFDQSSGGSDLVIRSSTISGNTSGGPGGGIFVGAYYQNNDVRIDGAVISGNASTAQGGGGLFARGVSDVAINQTTIADNDAVERGGGLSVYYGDVVSIENVTISGNAADGGGGGLNIDGTRLEMANATISGNTSVSDGGGLALSDERFTISETTITLNSAVNGGGIAGTDGAYLTIVNSIVSGNTATTGPDVTFSSPYLEIGHSLIGVTTDLAFADLGGVLTGMDPLLGPLADNGGITLTHALLVGSPAIDAGGLSATLSLDQRGQVRIAGANVDLGAVEGLTLPPDVIVTSAAEPAGANCALGGIRVSGGVDTDIDGTLDADEITDTSYVCNAAMAAVVRTTAEAAGTNCQYGGQRVEGGLDDDGNGTLEDGEVDVTSYVCAAKAKGGGCAAAPGTSGRSAPPWAALVAAVAAVFGRRRKQR